MTSATEYWYGAGGSVVVERAGAVVAVELVVDGAVVLVVLVVAVDAVVAVDDVVVTGPALWADPLPHAASSIASATVRLKEAA